MTPSIIDPSEDGRRYVSRGGIKLAHAIRTLKVDVEDRRCADFGCNVGGFTDCLLQHGAASVISLDTAYGILDYRLRRDPRVIVMERTNVLHAEPPPGGVDLIVIDAGWTPQSLVLPKARQWLAGSPACRIVSLIKPHYELAKIDPARVAIDWPGLNPRNGNVLDSTLAQWTVGLVTEEISRQGALTLLGICESPIRGGASRGIEGNIEFLALLAPSPAGT